MKKVLVFLCVMLLVFSFLCTANAKLVGYWNFDENNGSMVYDSSGNGNDGSIVGATWVPGKYRSALSFDGTDDWVEVLNSPSINTATFTVSEWVSFANLDKSHVLLDKRNGQWWRNFGLYYYAKDTPPGGAYGNYLAVIIGNNSFVPNNYSNAAYASVILTEDQFYYITATYDLNTLRLYLNGSLIASKNLPMSNTTGLGNLYIGAQGNPTNYSGRTDGIIDDVRIYNHVLTQSEILADMYAPFLPKW
jgi:hypothetical protein